MKWNEQYPCDRQPTPEQISAYMKSSLWEMFCTRLEQGYNVQPSYAYSQCSAAPGWNVKYRKGGRALCTLYPNQGYFTCLVSVGQKEAAEAEMLLSACTEYIRTLYWHTKPFNGSRWMMIDVTSQDILQDVCKLIALRVSPKKTKI